MKSEIEIIIQEKIKIRQDLWNEYDESRFIAKDDYYKIEEPKEIDELSDEILDLLTNHHKNLPVDFVMESLSMLGKDLSILYNGNGQWCVTGDCFSTTSIEPCDVTVSYFVEKYKWKPTIREAMSVLFEEFEDFKQLRSL